MRYFFVSVILLNTILLTAQETGETAGKAGVTDVAESDPGLFLMMIIFLIGLTCALAISALLLLLLIAICSVLIFAGIISVSVLAGLFFRSMKAGLKTFSYLIFGVLGTVSGLIGYAIFIKLRGEAFEPNYFFFASGFAGLIGGLLFSRFFIFFLKRIMQYFILKK